MHDFLLFSLYGVSWGHIVTGDITFLSGVDGASLPPVAFPKERSQSQIRNTDTEGPTPQQKSKAEVKKY